MISMTTCLFRCGRVAAARRNVVRMVFLAVVSILPWRAAHAEPGAVSARTWKTVAELSAEERATIDFSPTTPRHPEFPYLPAEPFPFTPPYTAEEMGLRSMELITYWRKWTSSSVRVYGAIDAYGYMPTWGQMVASISYPVPDGIARHPYAKPGQIVHKALLQFLAPPEVFGNQILYLRYRTDQTFTKKDDTFRYTSALRRARRSPAPPRQDQYVSNPYTYDDDVGRDAWEFDWKLLGTDVLYHTVRFPVTRPTITRANADGSFRDVPTRAIKLMGDAYSWYTPEGGVQCYVVEATAKPDWLPNYYAPRIIYWLDQHTFLPLRTEQYGPDGKLFLVSVRLGELLNAALGERGYQSVAFVDWKLSTDHLSYLVSDLTVSQSWSATEQAVFFAPSFLPREWRLTSLKSQANVPSPQEFFLRPTLEEGKFPEERRMELSPELRARIQAQEQAGRLVFVGETPSAPLTSATIETKALPRGEAVDASNPAQDVRPEQTPGSNSSHSLGSLANQREKKSGKETGMEASLE